MPLKDFSIIEVILISPKLTPDEIKIYQHCKVISYYQDSTHSHFIIQGALLPKILTKEAVIFSHSPANLNWCMNRMQNQKTYHQSKSIVEEIEELIDFMEIPLEQTELLLEKIKFHRKNLISSGS